MKNTVFCLLIVAMAACSPGPESKEKKRVICFTPFGNLDADASEVRRGSLNGDSLIFDNGPQEIEVPALNCLTITEKE
jgi:hypothetical protein